MLQQVRSWHKKKNVPVGTEQFFGVWVWVCGWVGGWVCVCLCVCECVCVCGDMDLCMPDDRDIDVD